MSEIENNLVRLRQERGFSAMQLAKVVGISRQTIYAMEAGDYVPNTVVALKLAKALDVRVEDLFALGEEAEAAELRSKQIALLPGSQEPQPGQPVQLCRVDERLMATMPSPQQWYLPVSDAVLINKKKVQTLLQANDFRNRILVAGCDPGISVLARHVQSAGIELVLAHRNSSQALTLLREGSVHIAGTHLRDEAGGESNLPAIRRMFPKNSVAVVSFSMWEEGIVTEQGNPKQIKGIEDFARSNVRIVNREEGSGSRLVLDSNLRRLKIRRHNVRGFNSTALGHLPAAWQVYSGAVDCCIATLAAARLFGLGFIPVVSERYDLAIRKDHLELPMIQTLFDALSRSRFRRELESLGGYDMKAAGQRLL